MKEAQSVAIIGTREPDHFQGVLASNVAFELSRHGIRIRTGGAFGIDLQAMIGTAEDMLDVYLPWASYNQGVVPVHARKTVYNQSLHSDWTKSVGNYHPAADRLTRGPFALHARNFGIISGALFVLALPGSRQWGGTGQGIRIACGLGIPHIIRCRGEMDCDETNEVLDVIYHHLLQKAA